MRNLPLFYASKIVEKNMKIIAKKLAYVRYFL